MTYKSHPACGADMLFSQNEKGNMSPTCNWQRHTPSSPSKSPPHHQGDFLTFLLCKDSRWSQLRNNRRQHGCCTEQATTAAAQIRRLSLHRLSPQSSMNRSLFTQAALWSSLSVTQTHSALHQGIFSFCFLFKTLGHKGCSSSHTTETKSWGRAKKKRKKKNLALNSLSKVKVKDLKQSTQHHCCGKGQGQGLQQGSAASSTAENNNKNTQGERLLWEMRFLFVLPLYCH